MTPGPGLSPEAAYAIAGLKRGVRRLREAVGGPKESLRQDALHLGRELIDGFIEPGLEKDWVQLANQASIESPWEDLHSIASGAHQGKASFQHDGHDYLTVTYHPKIGLTDKIRKKGRVSGQVRFAIHEKKIPSLDSPSFQELSPVKDEKSIVPLQADFGGVELWFFDPETTPDHIALDVSIVDEIDGVHRGFYQGREETPGKIALIDTDELMVGHLERTPALDFELTDADGVTNPEEYYVWSFSPAESIRQERKLQNDITNASREVFTQMGLRCYFQDGSVGQLDPSAYEYVPTDIDSPWRRVENEFVEYGVKVSLKDLQSIGRFRSHLEFTGVYPPQVGQDTYAVVRYYDNHGNVLYSLTTHVEQKEDGKVALRPFWADFPRSRLRMLLVNPEMKDLAIVPEIGKAQSALAVQLETMVRHVKAINGYEQASIRIDPPEHNPKEEIERISVFDSDDPGKVTRRFDLDSFPDLYISGAEDLSLEPREAYVCPYARDEE